MRRRWRTEVRRYEGKPNATAARFDKAELAATESKQRQQRPPGKQAAAANSKTEARAWTGSGAVLFYE
jgi:hypothetical protein